MRWFRRHMFAGGERTGATSLRVLKESLCAKNIPCVYPMYHAQSGPLDGHWAMEFHFLT